MWWSDKPYVSVAERRAKAAREIRKMEKDGHKARPVVIEGKGIAQTFWGKAWCDNLESYSDYSNRLPRGRSYVRNGSVCDLQVEPGRVTALVCGSELYEITIGIKALAPAAWDAVKRQCAGQIGSVIELLQGRLSQAVMQIITRREGGLFPKPAEIDLRCSCPDWAGMCKHVAAALYGVGARLDQHPELLFVLRKVDPLELIGQAGDIRSLTRRKGAAKTIAAGALADVFGIELEVPEAAAEPAALIRKGTRRPARAAKATVGAKAPAAPAAKKSAKPGGASGRRGPDARPPSRPSRNGRAVRR